tara:strand:- start:799 stop:966 length:168 start_codon:yes stop_codon:yes gene_type:complete
MAATEGAIGFYEVAFELPYSTGLQLMWAYKVANGEVIRAMHRDVDRLHNVEELIG